MGIGAILFLAALAAMAGAAIGGSQWQSDQDELEVDIESTKAQQDLAVDTAEKQKTAAELAATQAWENYQASIAEWDERESLLFDETTGQAVLDRDLAQRQANERLEQELKEAYGDEKAMNLLASREYVKTAETGKRASGAQTAQLASSGVRGDGSAQNLQGETNRAFSYDLEAINQDLMDSRNRNEVRRQGSALRRDQSFESAQRAFEGSKAQFEFEKTSAISGASRMYEWGVESALGFDVDGTELLGAGGYGTEGQGEWWNTQFSGYDTRIQNTSDLYQSEIDFMTSQVGVGGGAAVIGGAIQYAIPFLGMF